MKQSLVFFFIVFSWSVIAQDRLASYIDVNNFKGNIALHNPSILHLIQGHPSGVIISWNQKTFGEKDWQQYYNYPDYGVSFLYQDMKNEVLGDNYSLLGHYNFYLLNRKLIFRVGTGVTYNTNPYDRVKNPRNIAYGSRFLSNTYAMLNYKKERLFDRLGFQAGVSLIHYSNANAKAPNTSTNTIALNFGFTYNLQKENPEYINTVTRGKFTEPIKFNFALRWGLNQSDLVGSKQFSHYILSAYADKRLNRKSAIQFGTDVFFSMFLKEYIKWRSIAFDAEADLVDSDYKRVGVFVGHELFISKLSIVTQAGYYAYYPYDFEGRTYFRLGMKRYFAKKWFATLTLKSHAAKAESGALGIGIRL